MRWDRPLREDDKDRVWKHFTSQVGLYLCLFTLCDYSRALVRGSFRIGVHYIYILLGEVNGLYLWC